MKPFVISNPSNKVYMFKDLLSEVHKRMSFWEGGLLNLSAYTKKLDWSAVQSIHSALKELS